MQAELKEIGSLFQGAQHALTQAKCRVTAMARFNRAQSLLDELEKHDDPDVVKEIKNFRKLARDVVGQKASLRQRIEIYAALSERYA